MARTLALGAAFLGGVEGVATKAPRAKVMDRGREHEQMDVDSFLAGLEDLKRREDIRPALDTLFALEQPKQERHAALQDLHEILGSSEEGATRVREVMRSYMSDRGIPQLELSGRRYVLDTDGILAVVDMPRAANTLERANDSNDNVRLAA